MGRVLVTLTNEEVDDELLQTAKQHVTGTDDEILLCKFVDENEYQNDVQRSAQSGNDVESIDDLTEDAQADAEAIARDAFGDDVPYTALGIIGTIPDDVIEVAERRDCDHVFVSGKQRSPTGKVLFGDVAQSIVLQFDGPVTVTTTS